MQYRLCVIERSVTWNKKEITKKITAITVYWHKQGFEEYKCLHSCVICNEQTRMNNTAYDQQKIDQISKFLLEGKEPLLPRSSLYAFKKWYSSPEWQSTPQGVYHNSRCLVAKETAQETLAHLWADPLYTQTTPLLFYNWLREEFEGLTLPMITKFLDMKMGAQLFKKPLRPEVSPILTKRPKEQFQIVSQVCCCYPWFTSFI